MSTRASGVILSLLMLASMMVVGPASESVAQVNDADGQPAVLFVVDTSGSMGGTRIIQAKEALTVSVAALPDSQPAGLRSFAGGCTNGGILQVAVGTDNRAELESAINGLTTGGGTPTPKALETAVGDLPGDPDGQIIVLISDGQSTCGDPCPVAQNLFDNSGIEFLVHTVGFQAPGSAETQLQCIADVTGGEYFPADDADSLADAIGTVLGGSLRYNQVSQKSSHNSYDRKEALIDQLTYHKVRSIELDIHNTKGGHQTRDGDWLVYHTGGNNTTCNRLSDCLDALRNFDEFNTNHEVVTVFIDLPEDWEAGRNPLDLDDRLLSEAGVGGSIYTPGDMLASCDDASHLLEAVQDCGWPTLSSLRGDFIFVLTGDTSKLNQYLNDGGSVAFVAPEVDSFDLATARTDVVFYNHKNFSQSLADDLNAAGLVGRYYDLDNEGEFTSALSGGAHHLGTDNVNFERDPWSRTHNQFGYPFREIGSNIPADRVEDIRIITVRVSSDNLEKKDDSFHFAYDVRGDTEDWDGLISTVNSHAPSDDARGCLMARASLADDSDYFAVCRLADDNKLRVMWRDGNDFEKKKEADIVLSDTVDREDLNYVRLEVRPDGAGVCVTGFGGLSKFGAAGSVDPGYQEIAEHCFDDSLPYQGLATTSWNRNKQATLLYNSVASNGFVVELPDLTSTDIGANVTSLAFDGNGPAAAGICENPIRPFDEWMVEDMRADRTGDNTMTLSWKPVDTECGTWAVARVLEDTYQDLTIAGNANINVAPNDWWFDIVEVMAEVEVTDEPSFEVSTFDYPDDELVCWLPVLMDDIGFVGNYEVAQFNCFLNWRAEAGEQISAFGDSFGSGEGVGNYIQFTDDSDLDNECHRSSLSWPELVVGEINGSATLQQAVGLNGPAPFENRTCSGAKSINLAEDFMRQPEVFANPDEGKVVAQDHNVESFNNKDQLDVSVFQAVDGTLDSDTQLVLLSMGGNDALFSTVIQDCVTGGCADLPDLFRTGDDVRLRLANMYEYLQDRLPSDAQILVVGYPYLVPQRFTSNEPACKSLPLDSGGRTTDADKIRSSVDYLMSRMKDEVESANNRAGKAQITLFDIRETYAGHEACSSDSWIRYIDTGFIGINAGSFHPKSEGHAATAELIVDSLETGVAPGFGRYVPTMADDVDSPTAPPNVTAEDGTFNYVDVSWDRSTDNVAVDTYELLVDGEVVATNQWIQADVYVRDWDYFADLLAGPSWETKELTMRVRARDTSGNLSSLSNPVTWLCELRPSGSIDCEVTS